MRQGQKRNILDLVFTNDELLIKNIERNAPLGKSDHETLSITLDLPKVWHKPAKKKFDFIKCDFTRMKEFLSNNDWNETNDKTLEEAWNFFKNTLHEGFEHFVPKANTPTKTRPIWMNRKALKSLKKKYSLYIHLK